MNLDPDRYLQPLSDEEPSGPDLYETDPPFAAFLDSSEEILPERFTEFDRAEVDFRELFKQIEGFLDRTRDLRLLTLLAQLSILAGNVGQFAATIRLIRALVEHQWDTIHPCDAALGFMGRMSTLELLVSRPTIVLPLEAAPLFKSRRSGPISYRTIAIAKGKLTARSDETTLSLGALEAALSSNDVEQEEIETLRADLASITEAVDAIMKICDEKLEEAGADATSPALGPVRDLAQTILAELGELLGEPAGTADAGDGEEGDAEGGVNASETIAGSALPAGAIANAAQAREILKAVERYFIRFEPSHPAVFLVREACGLVGRSYLDALRILMPRRFGDASLVLGRNGLTLSNDRLQELNDFDGMNEDDLEGFEPPEIASRGDAMAHIASVRAFFSSREPTSPIPLLLEHAQGMSSSSFETLLDAFFRPED